MEWSTRRKILYALAITIVMVAVAIFTLRDTLFPLPSCVDGKQNGYESGIDCGGVCALRCTDEITPLSVLWAKAIRSSKGVYDIVAMVNNANIDNASMEIGFTAAVYGKDGRFMATFFGSTTAPLAGRFPIIIQNIPLDREPGNVIATLSDGPHFSVKENPSSPTVKILGHRYEQDSISRVYAVVSNAKHLDINNLPVRVVLFDEKNNAFAVAQTVIPSLQKEETKEIVFTWNEVLFTVPSRIEVYPIFNPFEAIDY